MRNVNTVELLFTSDLFNCQSNLEVALLWRLFCSTVEDADVDDGILEGRSRLLTAWFEAIDDFDGGMSLLDSDKLISFELDAPSNVELSNNNNN